VQFRVFSPCTLFSQFPLFLSSFPLSSQTFNLHYFQLGDIWALIGINGWLNLWGKYHNLLTFCTCQRSTETSNHMFALSNLLFEIDMLYYNVMPTKVISWLGLPLFSPCLEVFFPLKIWIFRVSLLFVYAVQSILYLEHEDGLCWVVTDTHLENMQMVFLHQGSYAAFIQLNILSRQKCGVSLVSTFPDLFKVRS